MQNQASEGYSTHHEDTQRNRNAVVQNVSGTCPAPSRRSAKIPPVKRSATFPTRAAEAARLAALPVEGVGEPAGAVRDVEFAGRRRLPALRDAPAPLGAHRPRIREPR